MSRALATRSWLLAAARGAARVLPLRVSRHLGAALGLLLFACSRAKPRLSEERLVLAFPELPARERRALVRRSFQHLGAVALDSVAAWRLDERRLCRRLAIEGWESLPATHGAGGRLYLVSPLGAPWLAAALPALFGDPALLLLAEGSTLGEDWAGRWGGEAVRPPAGLGRACERLRSGGAVLYGVVGAPPFASSPRDAELEALGAAGAGGGALLLTARLRAGGRYLLRADGPISLERATAGLELTRRCRALLEHEIRADPAAFPWML